MYRVVHVTNDAEKIEQTLDIVRAIDGSGIIYTATVKAAQALHDAFNNAGTAAGLYHGRLSAKERSAQQDAFMSGECRVMIATNAFGLGIDKPDVRFVLHYQIPGALEAYYQEAGRAGRDGNAAECILLYDTRDKRVQQFFLGGRYVDGNDVTQAYDALLAAQEKPLAFGELKGLAPDVAGDRLKVALKLLKDAGHARQDRNLRYRLAAAGAKHDDLTKLADRYADKNEVDREKLERMIFYAQTTFCRWKVLLEYFEEAEDFDRCGACDNCRGVTERKLAPPPEAKRRRKAVPEPVRAAFEAGASVRVPRYGEGRVVSSSSEQVEIEFADGKTRQFLPAYVHAL